MNTIVVGYNYGTMLGLIKSLGKAAYQVGVIILSPTGYRVVSKSKYVSAARLISFRYEELFEALEDLRGEQDKALILPANDTVCMMLDEHYEELCRHYCFPNIERTPGKLTSFMNKYQQKLLAKECGLAVAQGKEYDTSILGFHTAILECSYPCFVKPSVSAATAGSKDVLGICRDQSELEKTFELARARGGQSVIIEEWLPVEKELSVYGLAYQGTVTIPAYVSCCLESYGDSKGIIAEGEVIPAAELGDLLFSLKQFARLSQLEGLFCMDLLISNGTVYFSEMNLRCGASVYAITGAGCNLPGMLADYYCKGTTDLSEQADSIRFVNEKELLAAWRVSHIPTSLFCKAMADPLCYFRDKDDPGPWCQFRLLLLRGIIAKLIKGLCKQ